jgi:hypothetical protein
VKLNESQEGGDENNKIKKQLKAEKLFTAAETQNNETTDLSSIGKEKSSDSGVSSVSSVESNTNNNELNPIKNTNNDAEPSLSSSNLIIPTNTTIEEFKSPNKLNNIYSDVSSIGDVSFNSPPLRIPTPAQPSPTTTTTSGVTNNGTHKTISNFDSLKVITKNDDLSSSASSSSPSSCSLMSSSSSSSSSSSTGLNMSPANVVYTLNKAADFDRLSQTIPHSFNFDDFLMLQWRMGEQLLENETEKFDGNFNIKLIHF